jgi:hypothetical protein
MTTTMMTTSTSTTTMTTTTPMMARDIARPLIWTLTVLRRMNRDVVARASEPEIGRDPARGHSVFRAGFSGADLDRPQPR